MCFHMNPILLSFQFPLQSSNPFSHRLQAWQMRQGFPIAPTLCDSYPLKQENVYVLLTPPSHFAGLFDVLPHEPHPTQFSISSSVI
jgi:hypothetical protein